MEILEAILGALLQFVGELLFQVFLEFLAEIGLHSLREMFHRPVRPWVAALGYVMLGQAVGLLSIWLVPALLASPTLRLANLLLTPVLCGVAMSLIGIWRDRRGQEPIRLDRFAYGYLFALSLALVRFFLAT